MGRRSGVVPMVSESWATTRSCRSNTLSSRPSALLSASASPDAASTARAVILRRSPARWKLPTMARSMCSSRLSASRSVPDMADRLDHARPIDDAELERRPQIVRQRFSDARGQPGKRRVAADVREIEHADYRRSRNRRRRLGFNRWRWRLRRRRNHVTDEPITAAGDGLDVGRFGRIVAERLPQLRDRLGQRVVGDSDIRPERPEQLVLCNQNGRTRDEIEQQVDDLR